MLVSASPSSILTSPSSSMVLVGNGGSGDIASDVQLTSAGDDAGGVAGISVGGEDTRLRAGGERATDDSRRHLSTDFFTTVGSLASFFGIVSSCSSDWLLGTSSSSSASFPETAVESPVVSRRIRLDDLEDFERPL